MNLTETLAALKLATRRRRAATRDSATYVAALLEEERLSALVWTLSG